MLKKKKLRRITESKNNSRCNRFKSRQVLGGSCNFKRSRKNYRRKKKRNNKSQRKKKKL
jgi:hypothetical protein